MATEIEIGMKRTALITAALVMGSGFLSGCTDTRRALGFEKTTPDEFTVVAGQRLTVPPDFSLRAPANEGDKPAIPAATAQAKTTIFRLKQETPVNPNADNGLSAGEQAFLGVVGSSDDGIRAKIDAETKQLATTQSFIDRINFLQATVNPADQEQLDPVKEAKRLSENAALGKPVTNGQTVTIERKKRALLEGIF